MLASRAAGRVARQSACRNVAFPRRQPIRFQSTASSSASKGGANTHIGAGIAGGFIGAVIFYGIYSFTPAGRTASTINKAASEANKKYKEASKKLQANSPSADQAVDSIKQFAYSYVGWIPGGRAYVDTAFEDWEKIRENHKEEADQIVNDAYKEFQGLAKSGLSLETASKAYEALAKIAKRVAELSGDAISDIVDNHPKLKEKLGGNVEKLKQMGEQYGPEAKKQVDETWQQVKDIVAGGITATNLNKARELIEDKVQKISKLGDEAWKKAYEEAKPLLEKNPKVKELVENNTDALKQGNVKELFEKVKSSIDSGKVDDLKKYVDDTVSKAKDKASSATGGSSPFGDFEKYTKMIPQFDEIVPKLKQLSEVADKHREEGEKLLKETVEELKKVLEDKSQKGKEIAEKASKEAK
ncbi:Apolipoprotein/apolipophorin [Sarocladium implicatum]|nr:Apolipoprotein/apolipophorin [Sarocladium implicatum]